MYLHPNLLIPAILDHTLRPLLTLSIPLLLERQLHISPDLSPVTYSLCDLSLNLASLLILLPIETVRKRLQVQSRGGGDKERIRTVVKVREQGYVGVVEAIWRIVTEETGVRRRRVMTEKEEGGVFAGIRQLYRGVSFLPFVLGILLVAQQRGGFHCAVKVGRQAGTAGWGASLKHRDELPAL
jgi:fusion and transport protein UGO1